MYPTRQLKVGKELITNSQEAWLGYYVFAAASLVILAGGCIALRRAALTGPDYWIALMSVLILAAVCIGISIMCHLLGHILDELGRIDARIEPSGRLPESD